MMNSVTIMGRLCGAPTIRMTQSGLPVANFRVAVDRDYGGRDGSEPQTDFITCVAWRHTAEFLGKYFAKGDRLALQGRLQTSNWTDRDNNRRRSAEVVVDNVYFCESKRSREGGQGPVGSAPSNTSASYNTGFGGAPTGGSAFSELDDSDGGLPF